MSSSVDPPDIHHLNAAQGWLQLGSVAESRSEFKRIHARWANHPDVLETEWDLCAGEKDWAAALEVARRIILNAPDRCSGWINQSFTLHELRRTAEAFRELVPVVGRFPEVTTIPYNLACYACQLERLDEARRWLSQAIKTGGSREIVSLALKDPDLRPLWGELDRAGSSSS